MNVKLLRKVAKHISEEPRRLRMHTWLERGGGDDWPKCGTVGCIAGWAMVLAKADTGIVWGGPAADLLGLDVGEANRLFHVDGWGKFEAKYDNAKTPRTRANVTVRRIEHFIKTKGAE